MLRLMLRLTNQSVNNVLVHICNMPYAVFLAQTNYTTKFGVCLLNFVQT